MGKLFNKCPIIISPSACVVGALTILLLPLQWIIAAFIAAAFHELCHVVAVRLCGGRIDRLQIGDRGAVIQTNALTAWQQLLCILSGPMGSLVLFLFVRWIPRIALCALFHAVYNLLPIYPLDGGRAIRCLLHMKNRP